MTRPPNEFARRKDGNQGEIEQALAKAGYYFEDHSRYGGGLPDLLVQAKSGITARFEVKMPGEQLTPKELEFFDRLPRFSYIVYSVEEALKHLAWLDAAEVKLPIRSIENGT